MRLTIPALVFATAFAVASEVDKGPSIRNLVLTNKILYTVYCKPNASYDCYFVQENCPNCRDLHPVELRGQEWDKVLGKTYHKWCNPKSGPPGEQTGCFYVDSDCDENLSYAKKIDQCLAVRTKTVNVVFESIGRGGGTKRIGGNNGRGNNDGSGSDGTGKLGGLGEGPNNTRGKGF